MDEARRLRTGWTSDTANSEEWQQLKANWASATGVAKDLLGLGALSGPDMELVGKFLGTADPTQWKDPDAGIKKARENVLNIANDKLRAYGFDGTYSPPDLGKPKEALSAPGEEDFKSVMKGAQYAPGDRLRNPTNPELSQAANAELSTSMRTVQGLGAMLGGKDYAIAAERLGAIAQNPQVAPEVRKQAQNLLDAQLIKGGE